MVDVSKNQAEGHEAFQTRSGSWIIRDVPIFSAHVDRRFGDPVEFDASWLNKAFEIAKLRESEGYLPPLHVGHHGDKEVVDGAGKFRVKRIGQISHRGEIVPTLFADLIVTDEGVYDRIRKGELSFRSVEIIDVDSNEIDSLALLDDEVPYFRYPLLRISSEVKGYRASERPLCLAYSAVGKRRSVLFNFSDKSVEEQRSDMMDSNEMVLKILMAMAEKMGISVGQEPAGEEEEGSPDGPPAQKGQGPVEVSREAEPTEEPANVRPQPAINVNFEAEGRIVALQEQLASLQKRLDSAETAKAINDRAQLLFKEGHSEDAVNRFRAVAKEQGKAAAMAFANGMSLNRPPEPPRSWSGEIHSEAVDSPEVEAYAKEGAEALDKARSIARSYSKTRPEMSLADFLAMNMDPTGFMANARRTANHKA
jgi:hypothetical protein